MTTFNDAAFVNGPDEEPCGEIIDEAPVCALCNAELVGCDGGYLGDVLHARCRACGAWNEIREGVSHE